MRCATAAILRPALVNGAAGQREASSCGEGWRAAGQQQKQQRPAKLPLFMSVISAADSIQRSPPLTDVCPSVRLFARLSGCFSQQIRSRQANRAPDIMSLLVKCLMETDNQLGGSHWLD